MGMIYGPDVTSSLIDRHSVSSHTLKDLFQIKCWQVIGQQPPCDQGQFTAVIMIAPAMSSLAVLSIGGEIRRVFISVIFGNFSDLPPRREHPFARSKARPNAGGIVIVRDVRRLGGDRVSDCDGSGSAGLAGAQKLIWRINSPVLPQPDRPD